MCDKLNSCFILGRKRRSADCFRFHQLFKMIHTQLNIRVHRPAKIFFLQVYIGRKIIDSSAKQTFIRRSGKFLNDPAVWRTYRITSAQFLGGTNHRQTEQQRENKKTGPLLHKKISSQVFPRPRKVQPLSIHNRPTSSTAKKSRLGPLIQTTAYVN